jgi:DNA-binding transcriptional LysR family regulator
MGAFDDLALIRAFVAIVECGSISAGARRLRVSQPGLSRQLRALEEICGTALLRRDTHRMNLTEAGRRLLDEAKSILAQAEEADRRLREGHTTLSGQLRVFATVDLGQSVVTRLVSRFLLDHPKVTATLALTNRPLHMIQEGCDVGILPGKITDESVIARPAGTIALQLAASSVLSKSRPAPKEPADLQSWPWVSLDGSQFWSSRELTLRRDGSCSPKGSRACVRRFAQDSESPCCRPGSSRTICARERSCRFCRGGRQTMSRSTWFMPDSAFCPRALVLSSISPFAI